MRSNGHGDAYNRRKTGLQPYGKEIILFNCLFIYRVLFYGVGLSTYNSHALLGEAKQEKRIRFRVLITNPRHLIDMEEHFQEMKTKNTKSWFFFMFAMHEYNHHFSVTYGHNPIL